MSRYLRDFSEENSTLDTIFEYIKYLSLFPFRAVGHISSKRFFGEDVDYKQIFWGNTFAKIGSSFCCLCVPFVICYDQVLLKDLEEMDEKFQRAHEIDTINGAQNDALALSYGTFDEEESLNRRVTLFAPKDNDINQSLRDLVTCNRITKKTFGSFL